MKKRDFTPGSVLLILILSTLSCGIPSNPTPKPFIPTTTAMQVITELPAHQMLSLVSTTLAESGETPPYTISAEIPFLEGSDEARIQLFNQLVDGLIRGDIDSFRKIVLQDAPNPPAALGSSYDMHYALLSPPSDIMSLKFEINSYFEGAAHPGSYSLTINFDLAAGQELRLEQLFVAGSNYLEVVATYCKTQLILRNIAYFESGADPIPGNYRNWNITADGLLISFDPYQVAAYAAGPQIVLIPYSELQAIIDNSGPLVEFLE